MLFLEEMRDLFLYNKKSTAMWLNRRHVAGLIFNTINNNWVNLRSKVIQTSFNLVLRYSLCTKHKNTNTNSFFVYHTQRVDFIFYYQ